MELISAPAAAAEPVPALADMLGSFDEPGADLAQLTPQIALPEVEIALLRRYGSPPADSELALRNIYRALSRAAIERIFREEAEDDVG